MKQLLMGLLIGFIIILGADLYFTLEGPEKFLNFPVFILLGIVIARFTDDEYPLVLKNYDV